MSVLYGATVADGALAEIHFHLSRTQPVFPSKMRHDLFELSVSAPQTLIMADMEQLARLGVEESRYKELLYGRTQEIAAAAAFLGFDGLIAPSARWDCNCVVLFLSNFDLDQIEEKSVERVDWKKWISSR